MAIGSLSMGASAGISIVALFYLLNVAKVAEPKGVSANGRTLVDPDDAMLLVPFMVWFGVANWVVEIGGVVTPIVALVVGLRAVLRKPSAA